jgi:aspartyl-tRNA synthetase
MVLNGTEIGGGSVRIHRQEMQSTVFDLLGIERRRSARQVRLPAGRAEIRLSAARRSGLRSGSAGDADGGRQVHSRGDGFPKTQTAACPLTQAPAPVTEAQLRDLNIRLRRTP